MNKKYFPSLDSQRSGDKGENPKPSLFRARAYGVRFAPADGIFFVWGTEKLSWTWTTFDIFRRIELSRSWRLLGLSLQVQQSGEDNPEWIWHVGPIFIRHQWKGQLMADRGSYRVTRVR